MRGRKRLLAVGAGVAMMASQAMAQGAGFLTEQERLASYCAGVSETRMRELTSSSRASAPAPTARNAVMDWTIWCVLSAWTAACGLT